MNKNKKRDYDRIVTSLIGRWDEPDYMCAFFDIKSAVQAFYVRNDGDISGIMSIMNDYAIETPCDMVKAILKHFE